MSDWASASWVASLPSAFWMVYSELVSPAAANACLRYGASNSTYRVEDVVSGRIASTLPLPAAATDLSVASAENVLLRSLIEIDPLPEVLLAVLEAVAELEVAGAELLLLELLELLQPAATSSAVAAAAAVRPALADTEYNGVPRSFTQTCRVRHVRDQIHITRSHLTGLLAEMLDLHGETFPLTLS
jgi:hypothetical protein